jgi:hypothetical protein
MWNDNYKVWVETDGEGNSVDMFGRQRPTVFDLKPDAVKVTGCNDAVAVPQGKED